MSTGYLIHDLIDLLINEHSLRIIELIFHHVVVLVAFGTNYTTGKFLGLFIQLLENFFFSVYEDFKIL